MTNKVSLLKCYLAVVNKKNTNMKNEDKLMEMFQIEELEQRYEMGWSPDKGSVGAKYNTLNDSWELTGTLTWQF